MQWCQTDPRNPSSRGTHVPHGGCALRWIQGVWENVKGPFLFPAGIYRTWGSFLFPCVALIPKRDQFLECCELIPGETFERGSILKSSTRPPAGGGGGIRLPQKRHPLSWKEIHIFGWGLSAVTVNPRFPLGAGGGLLMCYY